MLLLLRPPAVAAAAAPAAADCLAGRAVDKDGGGIDVLGQLMRRLRRVRTLPPSTLLSPQLVCDFGLGRSAFLPMHLPHIAPNLGKNLKSQCPDMLPYKVYRGLFRNETPRTLLSSPHRAPPALLARCKPIALPCAICGKGTAAAPAAPPDPLPAASPPGTNFQKSGPLVYLQLKITIYRVLSRIGTASILFALCHISLVCVC